MGIAKNAAKDLAGEIEQVAGAVVNNDEMEEHGHQKRVDAQARELQEQDEKGQHPTDLETGTEEKMAYPDFNKDSNLDVEEVAPGR